MNNKQFDFIICVENLQSYDECVKYIMELRIPQGYAIDIITIQEADSIAAAYNAGMEASSARYKIYIKEDTFIIDRDFLSEILTIFRQNEHIGLIGAQGAVKLDECGEILWKGLSAQKTTELYEPALLVSGLLMATQYDLPWREDIISGWNFYDISHSMEMRRSGYSTVVLNKPDPWFAADDLNSHRKMYEQDRENVLREYKELFTDEMRRRSIAGRKEREEFSKVNEQMEDHLRFILDQGREHEFKEFLDNLRELSPPNNLLQIFIRMIEMEFVGPYLTPSVGNFIMEGKNCAEKLERYNWVKYVLRRIEFGRQDDRISELEQYIQERKLSIDAVRIVASSALHTPERIYSMLFKEPEPEPLVSVILPVYNGGETLFDSLQSILNQSYRNLEIILVDDGSEDSSKEIIRKLSEEDARIKPVFLERNHHVCYAANEAFRRAEGKYIAPMAQDDLWKTDKLKRQIQFLETHPYFGLCFTWCDIIDESGRNVNDEISYLYQRFTSWNFTPGFWIYRLINNGNYFCSPSLCFKREILETVGYYRYGLVQLQDYEWSMRAILKYPVYILSEKLVEYRRFLKEDKNLSAVTEKTKLRTHHETLYILEHFIRSLSRQDIRKIYGDIVTDLEHVSEKELECIKAMLLLQRGMQAGIFLMIDLFEDEDCSRLLTEKYRFSLKDLYEKNSMEFSL